MPHSVHVSPYPLDRVVEKDRSAAGQRKKSSDHAQRIFHGLYTVQSDAASKLYRQLLPVLDSRPHVPPRRLETPARDVNLRGTLADGRLREGIVRRSASLPGSRTLTSSYELFVGGPRHPGDDGSNRKFPAVSSEIS